MEYAFITGMGRSGTKFLASLLGRTNAHARHEHIGNREFWLLSWYLQEQEYTIPYLERESHKLESAFREGLFIDVNGMLHHCVPALHKIFRPRCVLHLVRDPRAVVRSLYTRRNDADVHVVPKDRDALESWLDGDKLYQVCWNWAETTRRLLDQDTQLIRFESIISDYSYTVQNLFEPLGLEMPEPEWHEAVTSPVNATRPAATRRLYAWFRGKPFIRESLPPWPLWSDSQKEILLSVCGDVMSRCGYTPGDVGTGRA